MGQKISPLGNRIGVTEPWRSRWYADKKHFGDNLVQDVKVRKFIKGEYGIAGISRIDIERAGDRVQVIIHAAKPGLIIGKKGAKIDQLSADISTLVGKSSEVAIKEVENPELDAQIVSEAIVEQLEKRSPHKRMMHKSADMIMQRGALGVKIQCKGRLGGAEIARGEHIVRGKLPLSTLRAEIDYGTSTAILTKGTIGVKVWIYKGEKFEEKKPEHIVIAEPKETK